MSKKGNNPTYRNLDPLERDTLFAFYEKHAGNVLAMVRDANCTFHSHAQIRHYRDLYGFKPQLDKIRQQKAKDVIASLGDSKIEILQRAVDMMQTRQVVVRLKNGEPILDEDGQVQYEEIYPTEKEIKVAWEIIKTEIGEPTSINKNENLNDNESINNAADELKSVLDSLRKSTGTSETIPDRGETGE